MKFNQILCAATLLVSSLTAAANSLSCRVVGVSDGDTLTCLTSANQQYKVRLHGIDAPESRQDFGTQAKNSLSNMVFSKTVTLNVKDTDRYGRTVADVLINGKSVNLAQVENGYAWAYRQYLTGNDKTTYVAAENRARAAKLGLWAMPNPINPSDFRKGVKSGSYTAPTATTPSTSRSTQFTRSTPTNSGSLTCGSKRVCGEMNSCAEAMHYLNVCGLSRLDRDKDGVPCESICR